MTRQNDDESLYRFGESVLYEGEIKTIACTKHWSDGKYYGISYKLVGISDYIPQKLLKKLHTPGTMDFYELKECLMRGCVDEGDIL